MKKKQKLVVINPNTSTMMTDRIRLVADSVVGADFELIVTNPPSGPVSIEGYYDEAMSLAGLLDIVKHHDDADGFGGGGEGLGGGGEGRGGGGEGIGGKGGGGRAPSAGGAWA